MHKVDILMWIVTVCTYLSYVPQIVLLIKNKSSEGVSQLSWILWVTAALCSLLWSIYFGNISLVIASVSEFVLCIIILVLCFKYKNVNNINLCGVTLNYRNEWVLLNIVINDRNTSDESVVEIISEVTVPVVLINIVLSSNHKISFDTKILALAKLHKLSDGVIDNQKILKFVELNKISITDFF